MVAHTCKLDTICVVYILPIGLHAIVIAFNTLCPVEFYIQWYVALHQTHWTEYFFPALEVYFLKNLPQLVTPNFSMLIYQAWGITEP